MTPSRLHKTKQRLHALRRAQATARDLESIAKALGRKKFKRGKEPTYESVVFAHLYPLTIPHHGGRDLAIGTKLSIITQPEHDIFAWEERLEQEQSPKGTGGGSGNGSNSN